MRRRLLLAPALAVALVLAGCGGDGSTAPPASGGPKAVVVTFPVLGAVVSQVLGDAAPVKVLMPSGADPHEWKPSPKDVEAMDDALLVVANGLNLEHGLEDALDQVRRRGVPVFEAADHVEVRTVGSGESADHDHGAGAADPHLWMSAHTMAQVAEALTAELQALGLDVASSGAATVADLEALDTEVTEAVAVVPPEHRKLVTGHESLGYFADRYGFELVGTVVPGLSTQAEVSAGDLAELKDQIEAAGVPAIFSEVGTPAAVVKAIASEVGVQVVELPTHLLPADGTYRSFLLTLARTIAEALR
jgi:zinc/manganese transport system substrate-binding protein